MNITVSVANKIATLTSSSVIVCGNKDYTVEFSFDSEWDSLVTKTARFGFNHLGRYKYIDVVFEGNTCQIPALFDVTFVKVGVYAGDLKTTTEAKIPCVKSTLCQKGLPQDPPPDVYAQLMELIDDSAITSAEINEDGHLIITKQRGDTLDAGILYDKNSKDRLDKIKYYGTQDIEISPTSKFEFEILYGEALVSAYRGSQTDYSIVVPYEYEGLPVTAIGEEAFAYNVDLRYVTLPKTIQAIAPNAFRGGMIRGAFVVPEGVQGIGEGAFSSTSITEIEIPESVVYIEDGIVDGCDNLTTLITAKGSEAELYFTEYYPDVDIVYYQMSPTEMRQAFNKSYLSLKRLGSYVYEITYDKLKHQITPEEPEPEEEDVPEEDPVYIPPVGGGCSSYVKDGKLYRNLDWGYTNAPTFHVIANGFEGLSFSDELQDGDVDEKLLKKLPYHIVDGRNDYGIMVSTHVLYNDWNWHGVGDYSIPLTEVPYRILTQLKSMSNIQSSLSDLVSNLCTVPALEWSEYLLHFLITDGTTTYVLMPPQNDYGNYVLQDISSNPKLANFRYVNREQVSRTDSDIQDRPTGIERFNMMPCPLEDLRFTAAYESPDRLSEFIGIRGTTKDSTDEQLFEIFELAQALYEERERDGQTWQTMHSVVYSPTRMEHLWVQENWDKDYIESPVTSVNGQTGDVTVRTYQPMPQEWLDCETMQEFESTMWNTAGVEVGMAYVGTCSFEPMPVMGEVTVEIISDGIALFKLNSADTPPYNWFYNTWSEDYTWKEWTSVIYGYYHEDQMYKDEYFSEIQPPQLNVICIDLLTGNAYYTSPEDYYGTWYLVGSQVKNKLDELNIIINNSINHRNIYRGKNLGSSVTQAQKTAIQNGTFDDLYIGDYWEKDGIQWTIADMDYWYNHGDINPFFTKHHLVIVPSSNLYNASMNVTNTTLGGYVGSKMYTDGLTQAKALFNSMFGSMVLSHREFLINAATDGHASGGAWFDSTVDLMNEIMVYGCMIRAQANGTTVVATYTNSKQQLALYRLNNKALDKRETFWLRDIVSSTTFAAVGSNGRAGNSNSTGGLGVRPCCAIG